MAGSPPLSDRWIQWVLRHHRLILVVATVLTAVAGFMASRLLVNADMRALLPMDHPVVVSLEEVEDSFGSTNSVNFLAKNGTAEARHAYIDALAQELEGHELLRDVENGLPARFFAEHSLYYFSEKELDELDRLIEAWNHYEVCSRESSACTRKPDAKAKDNLRNFIEAKRDEAYAMTGFRNRYEREGVEAEVVLAYPHEPASRLEASRTIAVEMRRLAREVYEREGQPWSDTDMEFNVLGTYITKSDEHRAVLGDMVKSGAFAVVGVVLVLFALFRSNRAVIVLLVPLAFGLIWSLGATQLALGRLNAMTATISSVVMGIGIDAGIHFYSRARRLRAQSDDGDAIAEAFRGLVVPLLIASSTTVGAFVVMATSSLPAFHEFGVIAALGVVMCLLSMVTVLPALSYLIGIKKPPRVREQTGGLARFVMAHPGLLLLGLLAVSAGAGFASQRVQFEYNARELQSSEGRENSEADSRLIADVFGKDIHAAVLVRDTVDDVRETMTTARQRHEARVSDGDTTVADFLGISDLLPDPSIDLQERYERVDEMGFEYEDLIEKLHEEAERAKKEGTGDTESTLVPEDVDLLDAMLKAEPFTVDELPKALLAKLRAEDGRWAVYAYPNFDVANMKLGRMFKDELASYVDNPDEAVFVGESILYASMYNLLVAEAPTVLVMAALLIAVLVFAQLRSIGWMLMTLLPLCLGILWLVGAMGVIDFRFTLFNLPMLPVILGIGVDNGVYLAAAIRRETRDADGLVRAVERTGGAILAATATTAVGFAAFMVADSGGMRGMGALAVMGILFAAAAALLVLPTIANVARGRIKG